MSLLLMLLQGPSLHLLLLLIVTLLLTTQPATVAAGHDAGAACQTAHEALASLRSLAVSVLANADMLEAKRNDTAAGPEIGNGTQGETWHDYTLTLRVRLPTPLATEKQPQTGRPSMSVHATSRNGSATTQRNSRSPVHQQAPPHERPLASSPHPKVGIASATQIVADLLKPLQAALAPICDQPSCTSTSTSKGSTNCDRKHLVNDDPITLPRTYLAQYEIAMAAATKRLHTRQRHDLSSYSSSSTQPAHPLSHPRLIRARRDSPDGNNIASYLCLLDEFSQAAAARASQGLELGRALFDSVCLPLAGVARQFILVIDTHLMLSQTALSALETSVRSTLFSNLELDVAVGDWEAVLTQLLTEVQWPSSIERTRISTHPGVNPKRGPLPFNAFQHFPQLEELFLSHQGLDMLPVTLFTDLQSLTFLAILDTQISSLDPTIFSHLSGLHALIIQNNPITALDSSLFQGLASLQILELSSSRLSEVPATSFSDLRMLQKLLLPHNQLNRLSHTLFANLSQLRYLALDHNQLSELPPTAFNSLTLLNFLTLVENQLTTLPPGVFSSMPFLTTLNLSSNKLRSLSTALLASQQNLRTLGLSQTALKALPVDILRSTPNLSHLILFNNSQLILDVDAFVGLTRLLILDLEGTALSGNIASVFASKATEWNLTSFSLGWQGLSEDVLAPSTICSLMAPASDFLRISHSSMQTFSGCPGVEVTDLVLSENNRLARVAAGNHRLVDVSASPLLTTLTATGTIPILDVSGTSLPYSQKFCSSLGNTLLIAKNMLAAAKLEPARLLRQCFFEGNVFDFSDNTDLFASPAALNHAIPQRVVLGAPEPNTLNSFEDTGDAPELYRTTTPIFLMNKESVRCEVDFDIVNLETFNSSTPRIISPVPTFTTTCSCSTGFEEKGAECVPTPPPTQPVVEIAVSAAIAVLFLTLTIQYAVRWVRHKQRERYILLEEKELQEQLLNEANEEVSALKQGWKIALDEIALITKVDEGAFGAVWKGDWEGVAVAVKFLKLASLGMVDEFMLADIDKEVDFLQRTRHPNLVRFFGTGTDKHGAPFLVLEFVDLGSLKHLLHEKDLERVVKDGRRAAIQSSHHGTYIDLSTTRLRDVATLKLHLIQDIADGMAFLHSLNVMHRDLKSGNVLVNKRLVAKITDFGSMSGKLSRIQQAHGNVEIEETRIEDSLYCEAKASTTMGMTMTAGVGTPLYMAPEILDPRNRRLSLKADVFSFGVLMWEVCECRIPDLIVQEIGDDFRGFLLQTLFKLYSEHRLLLFTPAHEEGQANEENESVAACKYCPNWYRDLSIACMSFNSSQRPPFQDIQAQVRRRLQIIEGEDRGDSA